MASIAAPSEMSSSAAAAAAALMTGSGSLADYVVEKAIGKGHFSVVHRAVRKSDHKRVALKKVQIFDMMDAKARDRCLKEVQLLQTLPPHPSIIAYLDAFIDSNELYIVFEWAEFGDLRRLLKRAQETNTQLQEPQVWRYFIQVCAGVSHMHNARVMHRDIKPANIFLAAGGCVKLGDLGLGRAFSSQTYEALSKVGTPLYMSPEVLDGRGYEWKSDVWSLGCLLYELACLRSPFKAAGDSLYTLFKKISAGEYAALPSHFSSELSSLVASMIRIDPAKRPDVKATLDAATAALAALEAAGVGAPHDAAAATDAADAADPSTRRPSRQPSASRQPASAASRQAAEESEMCALAMDAVLDKLKLLRYEEGLLRPRRLPPLARGYFVGAALWPVPPQFCYLYQLVCWLLERATGPAAAERLWPLLPDARSDGYDAQAGAAAAALLDELRRAGGEIGTHAQMAPARLRAAGGPDVCALLNTLTDVALSASGFAWAAPQYGDGEDDGVIEEAGDAADDGDAHDVVDAVGEADYEEPAPAGDGGGGDGGDGDGAGGRMLQPLMHASVEPSLWCAECKRIAPQLRLTVDRQSLRWRHRIAEASRLAPAFATAAPAVEPGLERLRARAAAATKAEAPLREAREAADAKVAEVSSRVAEAQARVEALAAELAATDEAAREAKGAAHARGEELTTDAPLLRLRGALKAVRAETREMEVRTAFAQQRLARRQADTQLGAMPAAAAAPRTASRASHDTDLSDPEEYPAEFRT